MTARHERKCTCPSLTYLPPIHISALELSPRDAVLFCSISHELLILSPGGHDCQYSGAHAGDRWQICQRVCWVAVRIENSQMPWERALLALIYHDPVLLLSEMRNDVM